MQKRFGLSLVASMVAGALAMSAPIADAKSHITSYVCGKGKHIGPNGKCRDDSAPPILGGRKAPCAPGFQRTGFFGRCHAIPKSSAAPKEPATTKEPATIKEPATTTPPATKTAPETTTPPAKTTPPVSK